MWNEMKAWWKERSMEAKLAWIGLAALVLAAFVKGGFLHALVMAGVGLIVAAVVSAIANEEANR